MATVKQHLLEAEYAAARIRECASWLSTLNGAHDPERSLGYAVEMGNRGKAICEISNQFAKLYAGQIARKK